LESGPASVSHGAGPAGNQKNQGLRAVGMRLDDFGELSEAEQMERVGEFLNSMIQRDQK